MLAASLPEDFKSFAILSKSRVYKRVYVASTHVHGIVGLVPTLHQKVESRLNFYVARTPATIGKRWPTSHF
jgi:hypothetical protein